MGAWIEILITCGLSGIFLVAPYMGAWIEICAISMLSLVISSRTLHGCVDWNKCYSTAKSPQSMVAPYMGAWIEILYFAASIANNLVTPYPDAKLVYICWKNAIVFSIGTLYVWRSSNKEERNLKWWKEKWENRTGLRIELWKDKMKGRVAN